MQITRTTFSPMLGSRSRMTEGDAGSYGGSVGECSQALCDTSRPSWSSHEKRSNMSVMSRSVLSTPTKQLLSLSKQRVDT